MQVLVVAARKGGVGKTTLAGHLGVEAQRRGDGPVAFIDTDPQKTLTDWWAARNAAAKTILAPAILSRLAATLRELRREAKVELVVIDTPPAITEAISLVIRAADLVLLPTRPSPHDMRALGSTLDLVEAARKPAVFVVNSATKRAKMTGEAAIVLSQHGKVSPVIVHHRIDFASSMVHGLTVGEVNPASPSALEVAQLWDYLSVQMRKHANAQRDRVDA